MKESLIDTDILSYYMRGLREVVPRAQKISKAVWTLQCLLADRF